MNERWPYGRTDWHGLPPLGWVGWPFTLLPDITDYHGLHHPWYRGHLVAHTSMGFFFASSLGVIIL